MWTYGSKVSKLTGGKQNVFFPLKKSTINYSNRKCFRDCQNEHSSSDIK